MRLRQQTDYPWDGRIDITLEDTPEREFSLYLRIPGWAHDAGITVNEKPVSKELPPGQYYEIRRLWVRFRASASCCIL